MGDGELNYGTPDRERLKTQDSGLETQEIASATISRSVTTPLTTPT